MEQAGDPDPNPRTVAVQAGSTVAAVQAAMALVAPGGLVSVLAYVGHAGALLQMLGIISFGSSARCPGGPGELAWATLWFVYSTKS